MKPDDPYYDGDGCLVTPARAAALATPAHFADMAVTGWDAGANSIKQLAGDIHALFSLPAANAGTVIGLRSDRSRNTTPELVEHGLYFQSVAGYGVVQVIEQGILKGAQTPCGSANFFEIRRIGRAVTYWKGTNLLYTSSNPSSGAKLINGCLYLSGDAIR